MKKQLSRVNALSKSLDELEEKLEPLLSKSLPDTLSALNTLQQAKLQVVLPYLINDLIFVYLKTRGLDPKTHAVVAELDRVRQYFGKIKDAEESGKKRTTELDKAAAGRFIKHAISEARKNVATGPSPSEASPSKQQQTTFVAGRVTEKMKEREEYQRRLAEESDDDEEAILEIIDDESSTKEKEAVNVETTVETQTVITTVEESSESQKKTKRKRPMDPFGSVGDDQSAASESNANGKPKNKKNKKVAAVVNEDAGLDSRTSSDMDVAVPKNVSKKKKGKKKGKSSAKEELK